MKHVKVEINFSKNRKISVLFDIGDRFEIPSKRKARDYKYNLQNLIKDNILMLSTLQSQLYACYRSNFLQLSTRTNRNILNNIHNFENQYSLIFNEYSLGNGCFIFISIENCFTELMSASLMLKEHSRKHKNFMLKTNMRSLIGHLNNLEDSFDNQKRSLTKDFKLKKGLEIVRELKVS